MNLLVDAHALIWYSDHDDLLTTAAKDAIRDTSNILYLSAATLWEISIKVGLKKLTLSDEFRPWINRVIAGLELELLPINETYSEKQASLPQHHGDPFDRMLVSQALVDQMSVVSADVILDNYGVKRIW